MRLLMVGAFLLLTACGGGGSDTEATVLLCTGCREAQVLEVISADSMETDLGQVNLFGSDTPERCASEATERLRELAGDSIRLQSGSTLTDEQGKPLAYVYTKDGFSIDEILIREGLAEAWVRDGQHRDYLFGLERDARAEMTGCLW